MVTGWVLPLPVALSVLKISKRLMLISLVGRLRVKPAMIHSIYGHAVLDTASPNQEIAAQGCNDNRFVGVFSILSGSP